MTEPQDTGDVAEVPEDQRSDTDDYDNPENQNDPVDLSDVEEGGEIVNVNDESDGAGSDTETPADGDAASG